VASPEGGWGSAAKQGEHVGIHGGASISVLAALEGGFSIQGIDGKATQKRKIMRGVQRAHPAIIFTKGDIERPVQFSMPQC